MSTPTSDGGLASQTDVAPVHPAVAEAFAHLPDDLKGLARDFDLSIRPELTELEQRRRNAVARAKQYGLGALGIVAIGGLFSFILQTPLAVIVTAVIGAVVGGVGYAPVSKIQSEAKDQILMPLAKRLGLTFERKPSDTSLITRTGRLRLTPSYDRAQFEDRVTGERHGKPFECLEAHLEDRRTRTDSKGRRRTTYVTVFKGQVLQVAFERPFSGVTLVARDQGWFNSLSGFGSNLDRARLESPTFEKAFEVWTNDQVEARYLLTPDVMQRFVDLEKAFKGKSLRACFSQQQLFLAIEAGNLFEPGSILKPLDDPDRAGRILDDFALIHRLIDDLSTTEV